MNSGLHYRMGRLQWRPMAAYWPDPPAIEGPEVLFAWKDGDKWCFGFGSGQWWTRGTPDEKKMPATYWVGEWNVHPECFAYIQPPRKR